MRRHLAFKIVAGILVVTCSADAQVKPPAEPAQLKETQPRPPVDAATRAMRREAEVSAKERERMFGKIRGLKHSEAQDVARLELQRLQAEEAAVAALRAQRQVRIAMMRDDIVITVEGFEPEPEEPRGDDDEAEDSENENRPALPPRQKFIVASESFDQWIFSGDTIGERQVRLNENLRRTIESVDQACRLTAVQRQKLKLAGRGDIKHFFDQVEVKRREFEQIRTNLQKCRAFYRDLQPLRQAYVRGPFDEDSLFTKIFKTMRPQPR